MTSCFVSRIRIHCKYSSQWWHRESSFNIVASFFNYCLRIGTKDSRWLFQLRQFSTNMSYSMAFPQFWVWNPRTILLINILNWLVPSHSSMDSWNLSICTWSIICRLQNTWPHKEVITTFTPYIPHTSDKIGNKIISLLYFLYPPHFFDMDFTNL